MLNGRCRLHGGLSSKGADHYNYQGKGCTKEERQKAVETNARIKFLEMAAIEQVFKQVHIAVLEETKGNQVPWENSSIMGDFYFRK